MPQKVTYATSCHARPRITGD